MNNHYLLDTHALLWFLSGNKELSAKANFAIADPDNRCFLSIASLWELAIKIKIGKLTIEPDLQELYEHCAQNNIEILPIAFEHILETLRLEDLHRDPFDRLIIAQAKVEKMIVISKDSNFYNYKNLELLW